MLKPFHLLVLAAALPAPSLQAATPDATGKAALMFNNEEWASAAALYSVLADKNPMQTDAYGHAIVASGMLADTTRQSVLTAQAFDNRIAADSLFSSVERISFSIGQTSLYEHYLLAQKASHPWLSRYIDTRLLNYYVFRRDPQGMIAYSKLLLGPVPDHEPFLYTLAEGYLLDGQTKPAIETYLKIVNLNPDSLQALLYLGNYYANTPQPDAAAAASLALSYLRRAYAISPTPYVASLIASLEKRSSE